MNKLNERKASAKIQFTDKSGKPLSNKKININLKNHEFLFGWGAFDFVTYLNPPKFDKKDKVFVQEKLPTEEEMKAYFGERVKKWLEVFNYGTLPFYWGNFEPEEGKPHTKELMDAAKYMQERGVKAKGHPLCWHTVCADWLLKYDNKTILQKQIERIHREVGGFRGTIDMWDAINEVVIMPNFDRYDNAITRICREMNRFELVKTVFEAAKEANPDCTLLINDFNTSPAYEILIEGLLDKGVPIDAIGIQSHQHQGFWGREKIEEVLSRFEKFGLPIHFTENTLVSGPLIPPEIVDLNDWHYEDGCSTPENEERQKNEIEEMYRILFEEHPLVKAITGWDFTDGMWLNAPSGLLHKDGTIKPAYTMLKNLIHNEWTTNVSVTTDANGFAQVEGFKGEYEASVEGSSEKGKFNLTDKIKDTNVKCE